MFHTWRVLSTEIWIAGAYQRQNPIGVGGQSLFRPPNLLSSLLSSPALLGFTSPAGTSIYASSFIIPRNTFQINFLSLYVMYLPNCAVCFWIQFYAFIYCAKQQPFLSPCQFLFAFAITLNCAKFNFFLSRDKSGYGKTQKIEIYSLIYCRRTWPRFIFSSKFMPFDLGC